MKTAEAKFALEALPADQLARSLFRERVMRAGMTLGALYFVYGGMYIHGLAEDSIQALKLQGDHQFEFAYRMAQGTGWIGSLFGTGFFARFAHKAHRRIEELESTPSFTSTEKRTEPEVLGELKRVQ